MAMPGNQLYPLRDAEFLAVCCRTDAKASNLTFYPLESGLKAAPYVRKNYDLDGCRIRHQNKPKTNINETGKRFIRTVLPMTSKCNLPKWEREGITHPFLKSVDLLRAIIRVYSNPGDLVVDGFAGAASTLIAAEIEGRQSVGFEIDKKYYDEGITRFDRIPTELLKTNTK